MALCDLQNQGSFNRQAASFNVVDLLTYLTMCEWV